MTYYDEQLKRLSQQVARRTHLEKSLKTLYNQREELTTKVSELEKIKLHEEADVERLEGRSLSAFFYGAIGKKDEKLDREREEAYIAAVKYDGAMKELTAVNDNIESYLREMSALEGCEEQYAKALKEKGESIKASGSQAGTQIFDLEETMTGLENRKKEITEAICAGEAALDMAEEVSTVLDDAEGWGVWDAFGGGLVSTAMKYGSIDHAQELIEQLQVHLNTFSTELTDVAIYSEIQAKVEGFLRFADYFFDDFFSDWAVLDEIKKSKEQVDSVKLNVTETLDKLKSISIDVEKEYEIANMKRERLIIEAI